MIDDIVVMPGSVRLDLKTLQAVAGEFGWGVKVADNPQEPPSSARTVLFHRDALGAECSWLDAVRRLRAALPEARLIACHGFADAIDWPQLCEAGAFHALGLPLRENEVRKSLGFISEAEKRVRTEPL